MFLFALYHVAIIIVLINMLIAMMSHSFEDIQVTDLSERRYSNLFDDQRSIMNTGQMSDYDGRHDKRQFEDNTAIR